MTVAEGIEGRVRTGNGAGVRARQLLADVGAPELVGDYRLAGLVRPPRRARRPI